MFILEPAGTVWARSWRPGQLPNGGSFDCANCHIDPGGGGPRNAFGLSVQAELVRLYGTAAGITQPFWSATLAILDSDGDGLTNGDELGDPAGTWTPGAPAPPGPVSNPGDSTNTVPHSPIITSQPASQTVLELSDATFTVLAHGTLPLSYQWQHDGVNLAGATDATLTLPAVTLNQAGNYTVIVTNTVGVTPSAPALLTITPLPLVPVILVQPVSQVVAERANATFTVTAIGKPTLRYQWQKGGVDIAGATTSTLTLTAIAPAQAGTYRVAVTNPNGSITSVPATLAVDLLPSVAITSPTNDSTFTTPALLTIEANASDPDGSVSKVDFFDGSTLLRSVSAPPYRTTVLLAFSGTHQLTAVATDNEGVTNVSSVVTVSVTGAKLWDVDILDFTFSPANINVVAGDTVRWTARGPLTHTVTSFSGFFNAFNLTNGSTFAFTFTNAGNYGYYCLAHGNFVGSQRGTVTTRPAPPYATTGLVTSSSNPARPGQLVTCTFQVSTVFPGLGPVTGPVHFRVDGVDFGPPIVLSGGVARLDLTSLTHGFHTITAEYPGEVLFLGTTNSLNGPLLINTAPLAGTDVMERSGVGGTKVPLATLLSNDQDNDGDPLRLLALDTVTANGGSIDSGGSWVFYTPPPGFTNEDSFTYSIADTYSSQSTGAVVVRTKVENAPAATLQSVNLGNGSYLLRFDGIPGRTYRIDYTTDASLQSWQQLGTGTANPFGSFTFIDTPPIGSAPRFYRSVYP